MTNTKNLKITIGFVLFFAIISMSFKLKPIAAAYESFLPKTVYEVSYNFFAKGKDKKVFVKSFLPKNNERQKIVKTIHKSDDMNFTTKIENENTRAIWRANNIRNFYSINYSFTFKGKAIKYIIDDNISIHNIKKQDLNRYLKAEKYIEINHQKIKNLSDKLSKNSNNLNTILTSFFDYVYNLPSAPIRDVTSALTAFEQNKASCNGKARLFVALCRTKGIPARLKGGLILEETQKRTSHLWAEVLIQNKWIPFDALNGHFAYLPSYYLELYAGDHFLITHTPNILFDYTYKMKKVNHIPFINITTDDRVMKNPFSLLKLSESNIIPKNILTFLLLLPLGGLLIAILKNVIGLKTFGVFLPILIAYTLTTVGFFTGLLLFLTIMGLVGLISIPLGKWGLLYTPKMVVILGCTVVAIFILINLGIQYNIKWLLSLSFFPIIITAIVSERFARAIEEDGYQSAIATLLQTLIATAICYLVFASFVIKTLLLIFPELILITIVITIMLGKWIGLRLSEYKRFSYIINS